MKFGSLFSGIGGFDLGLERAGMECAWQVEIDKYANEVRSNYWSNIKQFKDVKDVGKRNLSAIDLLCGGFPCQDLSVAGRRTGLAGKRSGLWFEFARIIKEIHPRWVIIENVPGLLSSNKGRDMGILTGTLAKFGYGWAYRVLDSQYFGVAQRRRRVFIIAHASIPSYPAKVLFEPESSERHTPPSREKGEENSRPIGTLPASGGGLSRPAGQGNELDFVIPEVSNSVGTKRRDGIETDHETFLPTIIKEREGKKGGGKGAMYGDKSFTLAKNNDQVLAYNITFGDSGGTRKDRPNGGLYISKTEKANSLTIGEKDKTLIAFGHSGGETIEINKLANTINSQTGSETTAMIQGIAENLGIRRLTPLYCERLQGFPDGWTKGQSNTQRYKMLGNAVTVPVIEWIGKRIMEVEYEQNITNTG